MNDRVKSLINSLTTKSVEDIAFNRVRDCRFGIFWGGFMGFAWICLDIVEVEDPEGSGNKVEKLWAHTNDFDPMVYGWSNCEFSLVTTDRHEAVAKIVAFLESKVQGAERIEAKYAATPLTGNPTGVLVADSDSPELKEPVDIMGC